MRAARADERLRRREPVREPHAVRAHRGPQHATRAISRATPRWPRPKASTCCSCPTVDEMYPAGARTTVHVDGLTDGLCGAARPTHFDGVTTVVAKLFSIVGPCRAYFGRKDAQQLAVVRRMATDLDLPVEVVGCPLVREPDGLAMSSRNAYLTADEPPRRDRAVAGAVPRVGGGGPAASATPRAVRASSSTRSRPSRTVAPRLRRGRRRRARSSRSSAIDGDTLIARRRVRRPHPPDRQRHASRAPTAPSPSTSVCSPAASSTRRH